VIGIRKDRSWFASGAADQIVRDDAMPPRIGSGGKSRVARGSGSLRVVIAGCREECALRDQPCQPPFEPRSGPQQKVAAERIHDDDDGEPRRLCPSRQRGEQDERSDDVQPSSKTPDEAAANHRAAALRWCFTLDAGIVSVPTAHGRSARESHLWRYRSDGGRVL